VYELKRSAKIFLHTEKFVRLSLQTIVETKTKVRQHILILKNRSGKGMIFKFKVLLHKMASLDYKMLQLLAIKF
jgi:hypothetical protein